MIENKKMNTDLNILNTKQMQMYSTYCRCEVYSGFPLGLFAIRYTGFNTTLMLLAINENLNLSNTKHFCQTLIALSLSLSGIQNGKFWYMCFEILWTWKVHEVLYC